MAKPFTPCATSGCPTLTRETYCPRCKPKRPRRYDRARPSAAKRGYGARWRKIRAAFLREYPDCIDCGKPATVADHSPLTRQELVKRGVSDPDAFEHLEPRCKRCHDRKTATRDGGFGR